MEQGKTATRTERKTYSNSFRSLEAIWEVLRRHSSPRRPLTVREIYGYLKEWEEKGKDGRVRLIPYEEWEDRLAAKERRGGKAAERNNCPRRYYLANAPEYTPRPGQMVEASMSVAPAGAKLFALQYIGSVEVLEPESLRQEIAQELEAALNTYRS